MVVVRGWLSVQTWAGVVKKGRVVWYVRGSSPLKMSVVGGLRQTSVPAEALIVKLLAILVPRGVYW